MSTVATPAPTPRRRRRSRLRRRQTRLAWLLLLPALAVVAFVAIYPLGKTVYQSFTDQQFLAGITPTKWVGWDNYFGPAGGGYAPLFRHPVLGAVKVSIN